MAMKERSAVSMSGWLALLLGLGSLAATVYPLTQIKGHEQQPGMFIFEAVALAFLGLILLAGCFVNGPNEARVLTFFGQYTGTVKNTGLRWVNPFSTKRQVSLRARNFETAKIKVNDI